MSPILNLWPVLLLPASPARKRVCRLNLLPAVLCLLFPGVDLVLLPRGYQIAASWHRPLAPESQVQGRSDFRGGVVLRVKSDPFPTEGVLSKVRGWIEQHGRGREHWVFEFGQSPLTRGGERAQTYYIQHITGWATSQPDVQGVCVFALGDYAEKMGLLNSLGRKRPAYHDYRALITGGGR